MNVTQSHSPKFPPKGPETKKAPEAKTSGALVIWREDRDAPPNLMKPLDNRRYSSIKLFWVESLDRIHWRGNYLMSNYLILKGSTWHVRLDVPQDVRGHSNFMMKKVLTKSLKTGNHQIAKDASREILVEWKRMIDEARAKKNLSTWKVAAEAKRNEINEGYEKLKTTEDIERLRDARIHAAFELRRDYNLDKDTFIDALGMMVSNRKPKTTISSSLIDEFNLYQAKNYVSEKTAFMQASHIREVVKFIDAKQIGFNHESIDKYLESLNVQVKTKKNRLFSGNSFWEFLIYKDKSFKLETNPFLNHTFVRAKKGKDRDKGGSYIPFSKAEVENLYQAAVEKGDVVLANTIKISAYTGCRIDETCSLNKKCIVNDFFVINNAKTKAGNRRIPIHHDIRQLVNKLISESVDGFLIKSSTGNKFGNRSDSISKRFGRLKTSLGYQRWQVFHSIRKTTATLLQRAGVEPLTISAILGHKVNHITFDIYSDGPSDEQKIKAITKLCFNFK